MNMMRKMGMFWIFVIKSLLHKNISNPVNFPLGCHSLSKMEKRFHLKFNFYYFFSRILKNYCQHLNVIGIPIECYSMKRFFMNIPNLFLALLWRLKTSSPGKFMILMKWQYNAINIIDFSEISYNDRHSKLSKSNFGYVQRTLFWAFLGAKLTRFNFTQNLSIMFLWNFT